MTDIAERIKTLRHARGWRLEDLEEATAQAGRRVSHKTIGNIERKKNPRVANEILMALVGAFGLTMEEFMRPEEPGDRLPGLVEEVTEALEALGSREPEHVARTRELARELRLTLLDPGGQSAPPPDTNPSPPARRRSGRT